MIKKTMKIICPWCCKDSTVEEWDNESFQACKSREMKRNYISLEKDKAYKRGTDTYYCCPKCKQWSGGWKIVLIRKEGDTDKVIICNPVTFVPKDMSKAIKEMLNTVDKL